MKVKAKVDGFYKRYRTAGEEFIFDGADVPFWCESLEAKATSTASAKTTATSTANTAIDKASTVKK